MLRNDSRQGQVPVASPICIQQCSEHSTKQLFDLTLILLHNGSIEGIMWCTSFDQETVLNDQIQSRPAYIILPEAA